MRNDRWHTRGATGKGEWCSFTEGERVNGVDERGSAGSVLTAVAGDIARTSGLGERPAAPRFSCISVVISAVLAVLYFAPV